MRLGLGLGLVRLGRAAASFVRNGLKLYYPFKDNSPDFLLDGSTSFDGTDDFISIADADNLSFGDGTTDSAFTISAWVKTGDTNNFAIFSKGIYPSTGEIRFVASGNGITLYLYSGSSYQYGSHNSAMSNTLNKWTHVIATYDGSGGTSAHNGIKLYVNGVYYEPNDKGGFGSYTALVNTSAVAYIGRYNNHYAKGRISNVGIWDRALSASEVESIYWRGSHSELKDTELTNLVSWYDLSSTTGLGAEVISNGTMETASSLGGYSSFPEDWTTGYGTLSIHERSSTQAFAGTHSLLFKTNASSRSGVAQTFSVTGSVSYRLEFYVYGVTGNTIQITHQTGGGTASTLDGGGTLLDYEQSVRIGEWEKITLDFTTTGSGTVTGTVLQLGSNVSGNSYYIDNVSLKRIGAGAPDSQGSNDGTIEGATTNSDSYSGESPFKPRIQDKANPKMAVQLADGSTDFDGSNDYIDLGDDSSLDITSNISLSMWVKFDSGSATQFLMGRDDDVNRNFELGISSNKLFWNIYSGGVAKGGSGLGSALSDNVWYHITATYDGSNLKTYVNGSLDSTNSGTGAIDNDNVSFTIGAREGGMDRHFNGKMANVAIHSSALTQSQIQELMFAEKYSGLSADLKTNLVSWYDMGSSSNPHNDLEGSNHGTNNGATVNTGYTYSPHGVVDPLNFGEVYSGRALDFDGANDKVDIPNSSEWNMPKTVSMWFNCDSITANGTSVFEKDTLMGYDTIYWGIQLDSTNNKIQYYFFDTTTRYWLSDTAITLGKWHHLVVVSTSSGSTIYLDGLNVGTNSLTWLNNSVPSPQRLRISSYGATSNIYRPFDGKINHVKIFNSELTQDQVRELYTKPETVLPTGVSASNLKLHLPMQEGSGSYIYDGSGNQNHGTISGATWVTGEEYGYQASLVRSNTPMVFDDVDDEFVLDDVASSALTFGTNDFTFSAWIYINDLDNRLGVVGRNTNSFCFFIETNGKIQASKQSVLDETDSTGTVSVNTWHHIAYTRDYSTSTGTYYIDGVASGTTSDNSDYTVSTGIIGRAQTGNRFDGIINEVAYWDVVLDSDAMSQLYNSGVPLLPTSDSGNYDNSDSLVGYWRNDGNTTWTDRANTGVASFDNTDDYIAKTSATGIPTDYPITLSAWFKTRASTTGISDAIFGVYNPSSANNWLAIGIEDGGIRAWIRTNSGTNAGAQGSGYDDGNWHHAVVVYTSDTDRKVYVDGSLIATVTDGIGATTYPSSLSVISVGRHGDATPGEYFNGQIAGCNIFNVALTASEISELYAIDKRSSISGHSQFSNCVASYLMGAGTGDTASTIQDQTSNNNDGTVSGASIIGYNDGTASGSPVSILIPEGSTEGRDNQGYYLSDTTTISNGIRLHGSEYIEIQDSEILSFGDGTDDRPFSLEAWIKMDDPSSFMIFTKGQYNISAEYNFYTDGSDKLNLTIYDESLSATYRGKKSNTALSSGQWIHVVATYDGTGGTNAQNGINLYINGSVVSDTDVSGGSYVSMENLGADLMIGKDGAVYTKGIIDEARVYSKELSASEVLKNYNNGKSSHQ